MANAKANSKTVTEQNFEMWTGEWEEHKIRLKARRCQTFDTLSSRTRGNRSVIIADNMDLNLHIDIPKKPHLTTLSLPSGFPEKDFHIFTLDTITSATHLNVTVNMADPHASKQEVQRDVKVL
ncbi:hypothetical protein FPSE_10670 [Fusarium pseudograminearum CS3096]|uniref:Uncharacterized protein n=1 Tax=Fusarium pseudograminearum (strain CS3096) TaxID=1028729 RepID=K3UCG1_FUSPC|nr:hypothetical protein FPSE_10670 [Fusarium pseudograminearum CS3096]EKJ69146.1 hypothetical protein FPSE_10670 [Fusarium pseudograminearum CS3096]